MLSSVRFRRYLHVGIKRLYGNTVPMIHNSLTNKVEPLQHAERINWYVCGPTVYDDGKLYTSCLKIYSPHMCLLFVKPTLVMLEHTFALM